MELGVGPFTCQRPPFDDRSMAEIYADMLDLAAHADGVGLDSVWVSEHHFVDDGYMSGPLPALAAIAARTTDIAVGTSISVAPLHDPVRLAEDGATIDLVSAGRLLFGVGLGYRDAEFEAYGVDYADAPGRLEAAIHALRAAWSDGPLGPEAAPDGVPPALSVTPKPTRVPPIPVAARAKPAVRRAALLGDGWLPFPSETPDGIRVRRRHIEAVREEAGLDGDFPIYAGARGFVAESREVAWDAVKRGLFHMRRKYADFGFPTAAAFRGADRLEDLPADVRAHMREEAVLGSPEEVVDQLRVYRDAAGEDAHFVFRVFIPGVPPGPLVECLDLLADEVRPALA